MMGCRTIALFFVLAACQSMAVEGKKNGATPQYSAAAIADEVKHLPGWNGPLPTKWFSGMLAISPNMFSHYIYVEREPTSKTSGPAPLMLWSNGGPGASSMFGLLTEIGPLLFSGETLTSGVPALVSNPYSWSKDADILIFDAPPPIGFSYCNPLGPEGPGTSCGDWDDSKTANANLMALKVFFGRFPALLKRDLFLSGESYAGVYIPSLARAILEAKVAGDEVFSKVALKGFAVGDACVGTDVMCGDAGGPYFDVEFLGGHHQFSRDLYHKIFDICGEAQLKSGIGLEPACLALLKEMNQQVGGFYEYGLYDECVYSNPFSSMPPASLASQRLKRYGAAPGYTRWRALAEDGDTAKRGDSGEKAETHEQMNIMATDTLGVKGALNDYTCGTAGALFKWVDLPEVRAALHVPVNSNWFCADNGVGFVYQTTEKNLMPFYIDVVQGKYAKFGIRVLVYNGDTDPSINSLAAQNWTSALGLTVTQPWRAWTSDNCRRMGGYVTTYGNFAFLTIRGAGHMVPEYKPVAASAFMRAWLLDEEFSPFNASCTVPPPTATLAPRHDVAALGSQFSDSNTLQENTRSDFVQ